MLKRRVVALVCLVLGVTMGYVLPRGLGIGTAEAGTSKLACVGYGVRVLNTTSTTTLHWKATFFNFSGGFDSDTGAQPQTLAPHAHSGFSSASATSSIVEADKGVRVLGLTSFNSTNYGYSECVKAK